MSKTHRKTQNKIRLALAGILVLVLLAGFLDYPPIFNKGANWLSSIIKLKIPNYLELPFRLGLDLQGGTHLIYQADVSQIESADHGSAVEGVRDVIERRVNAYGIAEPLVQTTKRGDDWRLIVELAGIKDVNEAINMIGATPILEFKEAKDYQPRDLTEEEQIQMNIANQGVHQRAQGILDQLLNDSNADFVMMANEFTEDPSNTTEDGQKNGGDLDWFPEDYMVVEFNDAIFNKSQIGEVYPELVLTEYGYHIIKKIDERTREDGVREAHARHILIRTKSVADFVAQPTIDELWKDTGLSGEHLVRAQVQFAQNTNEPEIGLEFNSEGKDLFTEITERNVGKMVGIFLDGQVISAPTVNEAIRDGRAVITGTFSLEESKLLVQRLNAGALPVPVDLISQQTVGASLGQESVDKSLQAGLIGLILIALFMIGYYRLPGFLAVLALMSYGLIVLAIFKLWGVTLTLAGLAGFILSIGMAVDANVLIFERLKEELKLGRTVDSAITEGFKRAWTSIRDGNISTLITCLILAWFSSSVIKGFAITLSLGIIVSMFSAIVITRVLLRIIASWSWIKPGFLFAVKQTKDSE